MAQEGSDVKVETNAVSWLVLINASCLLPLHFPLPLRSPSHNKIPFLVKEQQDHYQDTRTTELWKIIYPNPNPPPRPRSHLNLGDFVAFFCCVIVYFWTALLDTHEHISNAYRL